MIEALTGIYHDKRIYSCAFQCEFADACRRAAKKALSREIKRIPPEKLPPNHGTFTEAKSAYIGVEYEKNTAGCRLLFLSLDPGSSEEGEDSPCMRTPKAVREMTVNRLREEVQSEHCRFRLGRGGWIHWYCTHLLAAYFLRAVAPANRLFEQIIVGLNPETPWLARSRKLAEIITYFAHVNVVKCSIGKTQNRQAPTKMYKNCRGFIAEELEVLKPDIIVTQGRDARRVLFGESLAFQTELLIANQKVLCVRMHHPSNGFFWTDGKSTDERRWGNYTDEAKRFMDNR